MYQILLGKLFQRGGHPELWNADFQEQYGNGRARFPESKK